MADFSIKANDTWPPLEGTLSDLDGPIDLTTAQEVRLLLKGTRKANPATVSGVCTISSPTNGAIEYFWVSADTAVPDLYSAEFEITWADGSVQSVPNDKYLYVLISPDLG